MDNLVEDKGNIIWVALFDTGLLESEALAYLRGPGTGGICTFSGTTRNKTGEKITERLEYDCYKPMALKTMKAIADKASKKWSLNRVVLFHRSEEHTSELQSH